MCDGTAELQEGVLNQSLNDGVKVTVETVPVYRCTSCGDESMELQSAAAIEEALAPLIATVPANRSVVVKIHWEKPRVLGHSGALDQARFLLPEEPELQLVGSR